MAAAFSEVGHSAPCEGRHTPVGSFASFLSSADHRRSPVTEESSPPNAPESESPKRGPERPALRSSVRERIDAFGSQRVEQVRASRGKVNTDFGRLRLFPALLEVAREHIDREFSI